MIVYTSKECTLQIPKGLGNFAAESVDIEPLSGSVIELSATTVTLSGAVETLEGETSKNKADIAALSGQVGNLSSSTATGLETAQNAANSANILASSAYTRADEAYNLAESLTGGTGGIEKVDEFPAIPENGELVLLHIPSYTATTFHKSSVVNWEANYNLFNCNGTEQYSDGYYQLYGIWEERDEYKVRYRKAGNAMFVDVFAKGENVITAGNDAEGSQTTTIPERYELWKCDNYKWIQLDREWVYQIGVDGTADQLFNAIYFEIADYDPKYLTIRAYDEGGKLREYKPYDFKYYGIDCQASDSRGTENGKFNSLKMSAKRLNDEGFNLLVLEEWLEPAKGSGGGNYLIVNSLEEISDPYEGLEAYVKERTENVEYTGYTIDASQISEGYVAHIYYDGANEKPVYRSGEAFHWEWDNNITDKFINKEDFYYKINSAHTVFTVLLVNPAAYVTFEAGVTTATTSGTIDIFHKAVTYRYNGTEWEEYQPPKVYYLDKMTQAERVDLYNEIFKYTEKTFPAGNYRFFVTNEGNDEYQGRFEVFVARFYQGDNISFSGLMQSRYNKVLLQRGYKLTSEGNFNSEFSENTEIRGAGREIEINITSGGTIIGDDFNDLYQFLLYHTNNSEAVLAPFPVLFRTAIPDSGETCYAGTVETYTVWHSTTQNSHNYIIFTSKVEWNGRTRVGKWKLWYDERGWHTQTLYWGWLMNGLVCVYDNEYANWSQTEKEEWYDRIIEECWNYDNTSFGLIRVSDKTSSADTGYNQMRVSYSIYRLESIEAGYNSLHFSGSEKDGDAPAERVYSARIARGGSIEYWEKRVDLSKLDNIYDSFIVAQYDNDNKSLTGITHSTKATIWETYKVERNEGFARKTIVAYVHTGDVVPARFNLISVDGNMEQNESGVKLHFGAVYNSVADSSLHSVRFSLSKNVETNVYTIGDIVEYSYTAS